MESTSCADKSGAGTFSWIPTFNSIRSTFSVCDFQELYRYLVDDIVIEYCKGVKADDFVLKTEDCSANRKGKRQYLSKPLAKDMMTRLNSFFESTVEVPRIKDGNKQTVETLIDEEAILFARYLRNERRSWDPRIAGLT